MTNKQFLFCFLFCLGLTTLLSFGGYWWISNSFATSLIEKQSLQKNANIDATDKKEKTETAKSELSENLNKLDNRISHLKFEEINSKLATKGNEKKDLEKEITPATKVGEVAKKSNETDKLTMHPESIQKLLKQQKELKNTQEIKVTDKFMEAWNNNLPIQVPNGDTKENPLVQAIINTITQMRDDQLNQRKETEGYRQVNSYLERLARDRKALKALAYFKEGADEDLTKKQPPDFKDFQELFPPKDNLNAVNLFFALEYFPKHAEAFSEKINKHDFGQNDQTAKDKAREAWKEKYWKPMKELVSQVGIK